MTFDQWEEEVAEWIDLGVSDTPLLERMYKLGCTPMSAIDAIRDERERDAEEDEDFDDWSPMGMAREHGTLWTGSAR